MLAYGDRYVKRSGPDLAAGAAKRLGRREGSGAVRGSWALEPDPHAVSPLLAAILIIYSHKSHHRAAPASYDARGVVTTLVSYDAGAAL